MKILLIALLILLLPIKAVLAHCPLCTIGAGGATLLAIYLGISVAPVGVFIGAFALAIGLWSAKLLKKQYIPQQANIIGALSFLSIVIPVMPLMKDYSSLYVPWIGNYGSTYLINKFLLGAVIGAFLLFISPYISRKIINLRDGKMIPYQGIAITFVLLSITSIILEFAL